MLLARSMCETLRVERTESVMQFCDKLVNIIEALELYYSIIISGWNDTAFAALLNAQRELEVA